MNARLRTAFTSSIHATLFKFGPRVTVAAAPSLPYAGCECAAFLKSLYAESQGSWVMLAFRWSRSYFVNGMPRCTNLCAIAGCKTNNDKNRKTDKICFIMTALVFEFGRGLFLYEFLRCTFCSVTR